MNELFEFRIDTSSLTVDEYALVRAILDFLMSSPPDLLVRYLQVLHLWGQAPVHRQALALKLLNDRLPTTKVAQLCGLSDRQIRRYSEYQNFVKLLNQQRRELPRG